jgi:hypothetical protein
MEQDPSASMAGKAEMRPVRVHGRCDAHRPARLVPGAGLSGPSRTDAEPWQLRRLGRRLRRLGRRLRRPHGIGPLRLRRARGASRAASGAVAQAAGSVPRPLSGQGRVSPPLPLSCSLSLSAVGPGCRPLPLGRGGAGGPDSGKSAGGGRRWAATGKEVQPPPP